MTSHALHALGIGGSNCGIYFTGFGAIRTEEVGIPSAGMALGTGSGNFGGIFSIPMTEGFASHISVTRTLPFSQVWGIRNRSNRNFFCGCFGGCIGRFFCCATASHAPLVHGDWLRPGTHLDLVGGFTPAMREADDTAVRRARIFVDSRWFTVEHAGDLTQPIASGAITRDAVRGDLFDLCGARVAGRTAAHEITLFKSGGGAHLDLMAAQYIARAVG